jgi:hypothetical protein
MVFEKYGGFQMNKQTWRTPKALQSSNLRIQLKTAVMQPRRGRPVCLPLSRATVKPGQTRRSAPAVDGTVASIFQRRAAKGYDETCEENILLLRLMREPGKMPALIFN